MRLTLMQFLTLDGVYQGPGSSEEDPSDGFERGGWMVPHMDRAFVDIAAAWLERAGALLLGRRTYEAFGEAWPQITDAADPFAARMNSLPKYVASQTLDRTSWGPVTVLRGDVIGQVAQLKAQPGAELQVHGSGRFGRALLAADLVDELRLVVAPTVLGQGRRFFEGDSPALGWRVVSNTTTAGGLTVLVLDRTGVATFGTYAGVSAIDP